MTPSGDMHILQANTNIIMKDDEQNIGVTTPDTLENTPEVLSEEEGGPSAPQSTGTAPVIETDVDVDTEEEVIVDDEELEVTKAPGEDNECLSCQ